MKKIFLGLLVLLVLLLSFFYLFVYPKLIIVSGYAAKNMCSCVFVAGIDEQKVRAEDLNFDIINLAKTKVDYDRKTVTASVFGMNAKTAYYQGPTGCTMVNKFKPKDIYRYKQKWPIPIYDSLANWFEYIDTVEYLTTDQISSINTAMAEAFIENDPSNPLKNTRATLILHRGQLVAEQYAPGFDKDSRLMGWSMTKSLTASMLAMLAEDGKVKLNDPTGIPVWLEDERKHITWEQLLHMNSGLEWQEIYDQVSDAVLMLFNSDAIGEYAMQMPLEYEPDTHWQYSSGTTNILATSMGRFFDDTDAYVRYPYDNLFYKIGMYSMVMETDATGKFVGSSYGWATARDWAKMGQLYLQKGNWAGEQILSEDWVSFVQEEAPNANGIYGGHFWLNKGQRFPDITTDLYSMDGFHGQEVFIIPSKELVVVRLGLTYNEDNFDFNQWLRGIIKVIDES
jgi:CubicO group peptidase (beta-lactamase class C family)